MRPRLRLFHGCNEVLQIELQVLDLLCLLVLLNPAAEASKATRVSFFEVLVLFELCIGIFLD